MVVAYLHASPKELLLFKDASELMTQSSMTKQFTVDHLCFPEIFTVFHLVANHLRNLLEYRLEFINDNLFSLVGVLQRLSTCRNIQVSYVNIQTQCYMSNKLILW